MLLFCCRTKKTHAPSTSSPLLGGQEFVPSAETPTWNALVGSEVDPTLSCHRSHCTAGPTSGELHVLKIFSHANPRGPAPMVPRGTLMGQCQYSSSLSKHGAPPEPSPDTPADQVGPSRARGAHSANQTLSATRGDAAERAARSRAGTQSTWHGTPVLSVLTLKRVRGTA